MRQPARVIVTALVCAPVAAAAQVPVTSLGRELARSTETFTQIGGVHEFADGRALVVDFRENRVVILDFASGSAHNVTQPGEGPRELPLALTVVPWFGDTVLVGGHRHALKVVASAGVVAKVAMPFTQLGSFSAPLFADRTGALYGWSGDRPHRDERGALVAPLGGWVVRARLGAGGVDTVVRLSVRDPNQRVGDPWRPYPRRDAFVALPDGDVVVFRAQVYAAEVWRDGRRMSVEPVRDYKPVAVGAAERDSYRDEVLSRPAGGGASNAPGAASQPAERAAARRALNIPDDIFPPELSPFLDARATLVDRANNQTWVARSYAAGSKDRTYDVFDARGTVVRRVVIPRRGTVVGFGKDAVYVAVPDDDDVLWLEKRAPR